MEIFREIFGGDLLVPVHSLHFLPFPQVDPPFPGQGKRKGWRDTESKFPSFHTCVFHQKLTNGAAVLFLTTFNCEIYIVPLFH